MAQIECWLGSFVIFQGIRTSIAKKPYIFVIFQGGGGGPDPLSPLWIRPWKNTDHGPDCVVLTWRLSPAYVFILGQFLMVV